MTQIVVTRPRDEAETLARRLADRGYEALIAPMMEIVAVDTVLPPLDDYQALAFTSANGVRIFAARSARRDLPAYAVGASTAGALRRAGFQTIRQSAGDAGALAELIERSGADSILHLSGRAVARDLAALLAPAGIEVDRAVLYDARPIAALPPDLAGALYACTIGHVLFFSARTAAIFGTLVGAAGLTEMVGSISAYCFSAEVAAQAARLPWKRVAVAERPTTASLVALLPVADGTNSDGR
jgi:uroporphyrinogen-III synthase